MTPSRVVRSLSLFLLLAALPTIAFAATTEFRVLFDTDADSTTGCKVGAFEGVEQVLVTQVANDDTTPQVTRTFRQVCTAGALGAPVDEVTTGWPSVFRSGDRLLTLETRIPFSAFGSGMPESLHVGFDVTRGAASQQALVNIDGTPVFIPAAPRRRHAVGDSSPRTITLDGALLDWGAIKPIISGIVSDGTQALRLLRVYSFSNPADSYIYFAAQTRISSDTPFADDDLYERDPGQDLNVAAAAGVLQNDGDPHGLPLTATKVSEPRRGTVTLNPDGSFTYSPNNAASQLGDEFEYKATTGTTDSNVARVLIKINNGENPEGPPVDDEYETDEDKTLVVAAPGVLENDPGSQNLVASLHTPPSHGVVTLNADGGFTYKPTINFFGTDTFVYTATRTTSGHVVGNATVTIEVSRVNDPPSFTPGGNITRPANAGPYSAIWATNIVPGPSNESGQTVTFVVTNNNNSLFTVQPAISSNGTLTFTPAGTLGSATVTVYAQDNGGTANGGDNTSDPVTFTITITCPNITVNKPATTTATVGTAFSQTFTQSGAVGTATFTTSSTLPAGLSLSTTGVLSGTPTQSGTFPIVVSVTDSNGCTGVSSTYTLVVSCQTITVTNPATSTGTASSPFSQTFTQSGALGGATFTTSSTLPAGLSLSTGGVLSGTPTQTGSFPIVVTVTDGNGCTGTGPTYNLVIGCQTITVTNPGASSATANSPFSATFTQSGGIGTTTFSLASGTLPAGMTLAANGTLSGTPTQTGSFPITVTATDSNGCTGTGATYTLTVGCQTITVNNPSNANGTANAPFSETFTATNTIGTTTFTLASGTLPTGLTLAANGTLSGTPTQTGSFPITVTATDANGCQGTSATYTIVIACQTITVTNPANTTGTVSSPFSEQFTQTGAIGTATFTTASTLPAGLTLSTSGLLSGTPTQNGTFPITVTVTDSNGCTGTSATYTLIINCQTITVTNPVNATGAAGSPFSETFTQTGAVGTATFTLASGTLPTGITLATNGVLSGTPTQNGSFPITVLVTDANGCTGTSATYTLVITCQTITVNNPANGNGTANSAFSETFTQTGAIGSATFTLASGTLPAGLTLSTAGVLSGTPTQTGSFPITVLVTDANGCTGVSATYTIVIGCQTITVTNPANANGTANSAFSETFTQTGAIGTATFTLNSGTLPAGLTLASNGVLSGTPTQTGSFPITVLVTDSNGCTGTSATYTISIACQTITVNNPANANGTANSAFSETFTSSNTIGTVTYTLASGSLPAGLTLASNGVLSGTPTQTGSFPITVTATDANGCTGTSATYNLNIACQTITVTPPANGNGTANSAFSETFTQTGAIGTATFTLASGTLPTGLTLAPNGVLSGTPTQTGSFPITVTVTDSNGCTGTSTTYTITIACQTITVTNPSNATGPAGSPFSETFTQTGAIGTATFTLASGTLPTGLTLAANGVLSGTPTQGGTFPITVLVTDSNGCTGTSSTYNLIITCPTITVTNPVNGNGTAGSPFSETFSSSGGVGTMTYTLASGALPAGLSLSTGGVLSGTPTVVGSFPITVTATDQNGCTGTGSTYTIVIGCQTITVNNPATSTGTANSAFSQTFTQTGGIGTMTFTLASGTLPAGLTLATNGTLSGTPTQTGSFPITVTATDANGCQGTGTTYNLTIGCQTITVTNPANANGTANSPFSETFTSSNGIGTITYTLASGTLPTGLTLATNGTLSGTPTQTGSFPITVTATDANGCTGTSATYTIVIACQTITVTIPANANGTANSPFSETFTQTGAIGTATFTLASGTLPTGLTLAANGVVSGTPTQVGSFPITVTVTDSNSCTGTSATYTIVIACQTITVTNPANATGPAGSPFSETFTQSGAIGTATFTLNSGSLPTGLSLSTAGVLSGTPTQGGSFPITVKVTDSNGCTGIGPTYTLVITCPVITITNPGNGNGTANSAFAETFTQSGGQGTVTWTLNGGILPTGLSLGTNGTVSGTPTQTGTFQITVLATDQNGCTATSGTYTINIACQTISVTNPATTTGTANSPFSQTFTQTGGIGTTNFSLASGTLPAGLTLASNGTLSGTPTQVGSFPITVTATDSNGCTGTGATYNLVIGCQVITVTNPATTTGTINVPFSQTFTQSGAIGTATFTTASTLPNGITLATNGVLSGTPTVVGTFPIVVTVTDANGCTGTSATYNLVINCQTITVTNPANANGTVSSVFNETFTQTGANGTATFTLASGTLPAGLTLSTAGVLSGTPTQAGNFPITVLVTDSNGCTGTSATYNLVIACQTITVNNPATTTGTVDAAFSQTFTQTGGVGTTTFTLASGSLPSGLTLASNGTLSGTPGQPGSFPITVLATDSNGCTGTSATYTLVIACQTITVTNPGVTTGTVDAAFSQTFTQTGVGTHTPITWTKTGTLPSGITLNSSTGVLSGTPGQPGSFPITVTATDANGCSGTSATYTLVIACQTITVTNPGVNTATYNAAFSQTFTQSGVGTHTPIVWSVTGTLPTGITLNSSTGVLSGIPTQTGTFPITVTATDVNGCAGTGTTYTLAVAPVAVADSYSNAVNNTQLVLTGGTTTTPSTPSVQIAGTIETNDLPSAGTVTVAAGTFATAAGGSVTIAADGTFLYTPPAQPTVAPITTDSFTYTVSSNTGGTGPVTSAPATVTINLANRVWYVKNNAPGGGNGQSQSPFNTLVAAQNASTVDDIIYVYFGDGTTTNQNAGITLKNNQKLYGEGIALVVNAQTLVAAGSQPLIGNAAGAGVTISNLTGVVEVKGLNIGATTDAVSIAKSTGGTVTYEVSQDTIRSAGNEGIEVDLTGAGNILLSIHDNTVTATGNAIDIARTTGTITITAFDDLTVTGTSGAAGIVITGTGAPVIFDTVSGNPFNTVSGGALNIGTPGAGNGVGTNGIVWTNVSGDISFTNFNVFADNGSAVTISGSSSAFNAATGTGFRITATSGTDLISATNGAAINISSSNINLTPSTITSTGSASFGLNLDTVSGTFTSGGAISGTTAAATAYRINGSSVNATYSGTINTTQGTGVSLTTNTGTYAFSGALTLSTGANPAFTATSSGTVSTSNTTSTLTTTTGVALNVTSTTIAAAGLKFRSITVTGAGGLPASGIILNNTGATGALNVLGNGGTCSSAGTCTGGAIQNTGSHGISLTNTNSPSFDRMFINATTGSGVNGTTVTNFTFTNSTVSNSGSAAAADTSNIAFNTSAGTNNNVSGTVTITGNTLTTAGWHGIDILNFSGSIADLIITGNTITSTTSTATSKGTGIRIQSIGSSTTSSTLTKATIDNNVVSNFPSAAGISVQGGNSGTGPGGTVGTPGNATNIINITNNRVAGSSAAVRMGTHAILATVSGGNSASRSQGNFNISNNGTVANPLTNTDGHTLGAGVNGWATGTFVTNNNRIVSNHPVAATASNGISGGVGTVASTSETGDMTWTIDGNNISQTDGNGILAVARGTSGFLKVTVTNNTVGAPLSGFRPGIRLDAGNASSLDDAICADIRTNTSGGSGGAPGIGIRKQGSVATTNDFGIEGLAPSPATFSQAEDYVAGLNPGSVIGLSGDSVTMKRVISISGGNYTSCSSAP